jgi:DNA gyrase subunit B
MALLRSGAFMSLSNNVIYDASSIRLLSGMEAIRRMPAMYIGSTARDGVHRLLLEPIDNALDEAASGHCQRITVTLAADGSCSIEDDGRGIPVDPHPDSGTPVAELLLTTLHSGGKFGTGAYGASAGLHGVGLACVNALSRRLTLRTWRDGLAYEQRFARGRVVSSLTPGDPGGKDTGTRITFLPDDEIFTDVSFDADEIASRLREVSYLQPGLTLELVDQRRAGGSAQFISYRNDSGVAGLLRHLTERAKLVHAVPLAFSLVTDSAAIDVALCWTENHAEQLHSFVNMVRTDQHGAHVDGFHRAISSVIRAYVQEHAGSVPGSPAVTGGDVFEGLVGVIHVRMDRPTFDGQTKRRLDSPAVAVLVESVVAGEMSAALLADPELAASIVARARAAARARIAARLAPRSARVQARKLVIDYSVYQEQFSVRSKNWHDSCTWLTDEGLLDTHARLCDVGPDARMLDVCCGSGVVGNAFKGRIGSSVGLDITPEMVTIASQRLDEVHQGTVYDMRYPDESFDLVVNREVLHLLPQPWRPLAEVFRVLRPGGQFIVGQIVPYTDIDAFWMYRVFKKKQPLLYQMFTEPQFRQLLLDAGFTSLRMEEYFLWESIDQWIDTVETTPAHRQEILELFYRAPREVRDVHPFKVEADGSVADRWRWCVYSVRKPGA